jgi:hypothetical protein
MPEKKADLDQDDLRRMKRIIGCVHRHLTQRRAKRTPSTPLALVVDDRDHDPRRAPGPARRPRRALLGHAGPVRRGERTGSDRATTVAVLTGLPGTGRSTLADRLAREVAAPALAEVDAVGQLRPGTDVTLHCGRGR